MSVKINPLDIKIIYEDNHMMVVEKPINVLSQKDFTHDIDILTLVKENIKIRYNKPGNVYVGLLHRLDRPVGGVMVLAKTSKAASRLSEQIRNRTFKKTYLAVIYGLPKETEGSLKHYLIKDHKTNLVHSVKKSVAGAKEALLDYKVVDTQKGLSLLSIDLHTGRPHQIRVQFAAIGHFLYGDRRYGNSCASEEQNIALWSHKISCFHPIHKEEVSFTSNIPYECEPWRYFSNF